MNVTARRSHFSTNRRRHCLVSCAREQHAPSICSHLQTQAHRAPGFRGAMVHAHRRRRSSSSSSSWRSAARRCVPRSAWSRIALCSRPRRPFAAQSHPAQHPRLHSWRRMRTAAAPWLQLTAQRPRSRSTALNRALSAGALPPPHQRQEQRRRQQQMRTVLPWQQMRTDPPWQQKLTIPPW